MSAKVIEENKSLTKTPDNQMFTPKKNDYIDNIYQPYTYRDSVDSIIQPMSNLKKSNRNYGKCYSIDFNRKRN